MTSVVEKRLGALPVAAEFLRRLDVAGIIDRLCPGSASAHLTHGQVIEALVANRLTSPAPRVRARDWARVLGGGGVQLHLLQLLDTDIGQTRWPHT